MHDYALSLPCIQRKAAFKEKEGMAIVALQSIRREAFALHICNVFMVI